MRQEAPGQVKETDASLAQKERALGDLLKRFGSVVVAFSGGADSAYLAYAATRALGGQALCVTAESASYPAHHRKAALRLVAALGLRHEFIATHEMDRPEYRANPANRCYYCKQELYRELTRLARQRGLAVIVDGNNADDRGDYRPGRDAAREAGVRSPLDEVALTKAEIRELSRRAGLPTWNEPASACLSSRIPYNAEVTEEKLRAIEEAEALLRDLGFRLCRVRHHGDTARLEIEAADMSRAVDPATRTAIVSGLRGLGFRYIALDLQGYRTGSLNEGLTLRPV